MTHSCSKILGDSRKGLPAASISACLRDFSKKICRWCLYILPILQNVGLSESGLWPKNREDQLVRSKSRKNRHLQRNPPYHPDPYSSSAPRQRVGGGRNPRQLSRVRVVGALTLNGTRDAESLTPRPPIPHAWPHALACTGSGTGPVGTPGERINRCPSARFIAPSARTSTSFSTPRSGTTGMAYR